MNQEGTPFTLMVDCFACGGNVAIKMSRIDGERMDVIFCCLDKTCEAESRLKGSLIEVKPSRTHLGILRREAAAEAI